MSSEDSGGSEFLITDGGDKQVIPMIWSTYKGLNDDENISENWFQTMSIATVVWHEGYLYKLRMPAAGSKIGYNLSIQLPKNSAEPKKDGYRMVKKGEKGEYVKDDNAPFGFRKTKRGEKATHVYLKPYPQRTSFRYRVPNIINYKNLLVQQPGYKPIYTNKKEEEKARQANKLVKSRLNTDYLSPSYDASKTTNYGKIYNMFSDEDEGTKDITLKCFAFDLNKSKHFFTYIAGEWFITVSNPFKFFAEDMRMVDENIIAKKLKEIDEDKNNKLRFYVARENVDAVLLEVYPPWKNYYDSRMNFINVGVSFFDIQGIWKIICNHIGLDTNTGKSVPGRTSPYPEPERRERIAIKIKKALEDNYYRFVSIRPVWNTKERFDNFFSGLEDYPPANEGTVSDLLSPEEIRKQLPTKKVAAKGKKKISIDIAALLAGASKPKEDTSKEQSTEYVYEGLTLKELGTMMEDQWEKALKHLETHELEAIDFDKMTSGRQNVQKILNTFTWNHISAVLDELNILEEDYRDIRGRIENLNATISDVQEAMVNRANTVPGKFELFKNIILGTGIQTSDKDPKKEKTRVQNLLDEKVSERKRRFDLRSKLREKQDKDNISEEDKRMLDDLNKTIKANDLTGEINILKRELHALKNPNWVLMKDVLEKAGAKAENKRAVKMNVVYTLQEFDALLDKFSGEEYNISHKQLLQQFEEKAAELKNLEDDSEKINKINKEIEEVKRKYDETYTNSGAPDIEDAQFEREVEKRSEDGTKTERAGKLLSIDQLNSEKLFRGNKGKELDAFIKKQIIKYPKFAKFRWFEGENTTYGITYHENGHIIARTWNKDNANALKNGTLKFIPGESNAGEEGYFQLHIHKARSMPIELTKLCLLHEMAHAHVGNIPQYFKHVKMDARWNLELSSTNCLIKSMRNLNLERTRKKYNNAMSEIAHNNVWQTAADGLFEKNFRGIFNRDFNSIHDDWLRLKPRNSFYSWSQVHSVKRYRNPYKPDGSVKRAKWAKNIHNWDRSLYILRVFYDNETLREWFLKNKLRREEEIVRYDPDEYQDRHYNILDTYSFRKRQRDAASALLAKISTLQATLVTGNVSEKKKLRVELDKIKKKLINRDFQVFIKFAQYLRGKISKKTVFQDMANLYSAKTLATFIDDFKEILNDVEQDYTTLQKTLHTKQLKIDGKLVTIPLRWESQWFEVKTSDPNVKIIKKTFKDYMEAFIAICYTTDDCSPDNFKSKTGSERTNGIPLALRYAMTLNKKGYNGVHISRINEISVEKLKKFNKRADGTFNTNFLFAREGTRQQGIYDKTNYQMDEPINKEGYRKFHENAAEILANWEPDPPYDEEQVPRKTKKKKVKETSISRPLKSGKMPKGTPSRMNIYLEQLGLKSVRANPDGNCFFHALKQTANRSETIQVLRTNIVIKLGEILDVTLDPVNPEFQIKNLIDVPYTVKISGSGTIRAETLDEYLNLMAQPNAWADSAVVMAAMVYLHRQIYLVNNKTNPDWGIAMREFPQVLLSDRPLGDPVVLTFNEGDRTNGNHYQGTRVIDPDKFNDKLGEGVEIIHDSRNILAIIKRASKMKPTSVPRQSGLTCGMHAINNLMGTAYTAEDLTAVCKDNKTENWNQEVIMHFLGVKYGKNDSQSLTMQFDAASVKDRVKMIQFLDFDGLLGFVIHLPGHWTAMRRWSVGGESGFSYMDSLPRQPEDRLKTYKTAGEMADHLLTSVIYAAEPGDNTYNIYPVFLSPQNKIAFDKSGILRTGKKTTTDPGKVVDLSGDDPDEEHELIIFYAELVISLGSKIKMKIVEKRGNLYEKIRTNITRDLKRVANLIKDDDDIDDTEEEVREFVLTAPLTLKKAWLKLYVKKKE